MTYKVFQEILAASQKDDTTSKSASSAKDWFNVQSKSVTPRSIIQTAPNVTDAASAIGNMQLFAYDPKTKQSLPYYDRYPLIFMVDVSRDGFTGLNMHYLPADARARLMDALYEIAYTEGTNSLQLSYDLLKSTHRLRMFQPCFKRYLNTNVRSNFATIDREHWNIALFLPLARFEKASQTHVHAESIKKVNNG